MNDTFIVALLASLGPTLMGAAAWREARGANRAVNHVSPGEPNLVTKVDALTIAVAAVQVEVAEARVLALHVKEDLLKFNEIDTLGRQGRIDRRQDDED